jgi:FMN phosphatase YigB (HAD superfamily)
VDLAETLLALEEEFWRASGDRRRYEARMATDAVHVFPGWGITDTERVLDAVEAAEPWERFELQNTRLVPLGDDAAALVYDARANRAGQPEYVAAMITVYRRRGDGWELVLHQQTQLPAGD